MISGNMRARINVIAMRSPECPGALLPALFAVQRRPGVYIRGEEMGPFELLGGKKLGAVGQPLAESEA